MSPTRSPYGESREGPGRRAGPGARAGGDGTAAETRWLDPATLSRIDDLELLARTVVEGFVAGLHRSPFLGLSVDFAEHRPYMPGDDIRRVDWRVYARTDRFYVKQYEAETNADVVFALDASGSMDYGTTGVTKLDYARYLAACLAHLSAAQRDRVGAAVYSETLDEFVAPSARHRRRVLAALDRAGDARRERRTAARSGGTAGRPDGAHPGEARRDGIAEGGPGDPNAPLARLAGSLGRRGLTVIASDLYASPERIAEAVGRLKAAGQDVVVFHVLDPAEVDFPFETPRAFEDLETRERVPLAPEDAREAYLSRIEGHVSSVARRLLDLRVDHELVVTSTPLDAALFEYLSLRARRLKGRY